MSTKLQLPPLLVSRPRNQQLFLRFVAPALVGAVAGIALGASAPLYWILQVLAALGGFLAGIEHRGATEGAIRGVAGGAIYGAFILILHELSGAEAEAELGEVSIFLVVVTALAGAGLGALGSAWRARRTD